VINVRLAARHSAVVKRHRIATAGSDDLACGLLSARAAVPTCRVAFEALDLISPLQPQLGLPSRALARSTDRLSHCGTIGNSQRTPESWRGPTDLDRHIFDYAGRPQPDIRRTA
jgi:hypothetical protein